MKNQLLVSEVIAKSSAILHSDGLTLFRKLLEAGKNEITLSFKGIEHCTTAFLNASVGNYVLNGTNNAQLIRFEDTPQDLKAKIDLVIENATDQKKSERYLNSTRGLVHA